MSVQCIELGDQIDHRGVSNSYDGRWQHRPLSRCLSFLPFEEVQQELEIPLLAHLFRLLQLKVIQPIEDRLSLCAEIDCLVFDPEVLEHLLYPKQTVFNVLQFAGNEPQRTLCDQIFLLQVVCDEGLCELIQECTVLVGNATDQRDPDSARTLCRKIDIQTVFVRIDQSRGVVEHEAKTVTCAHLLALFCIRHQAEIVPTSGDPFSKFIFTIQFGNGIPSDVIQVEPLFAGIANELPWLLQSLYPKPPFLQVGHVERRPDRLQ